MKNLLEFIIKNITGSDDFSIKESQEQNHIEFIVTANPDIIGLIIGKEGKTIKNIRKLVAIPAVRENKSIHISVSDF